MRRPFERVHTMTDYYDGPRGGIASFDGHPHWYESRFDDVKGFSEVYELRPVDDEAFRLAMEAWAIWLRWEDAFGAGETTLETHGALPAERARHDELAALLEGTPRKGPIVLAHAIFRTIAGHADGGRGRWLEVQWTPIREER